jgi:hypothetical protein
VHLSKNITGAQPLFIIVLTATLINIELFGNATMAAYFFYVIAAAALIVATGFYLTKQRKHRTQIYFLPLMFFILLTVWNLIQALVFPNLSISTSQVFILVNCLLLFSFVILFQTDKLNVNFAFGTIMWLASLESVVCLLQACNVIRSLNEYLPVSGTWVNPNVTAMFLTISVPSIIYSIFHASPSRKKLYIFFLVVITVALVLLKCRTAIVGAITAGVFVVNNHFHIIACFKKRLTKTYRFAVLIAAAIVVFFAGSLLYTSKQASADGRQLI